jgi:hypothetical protein
MCKDSSRINCTLACSTLGYIPCKNYKDTKICASVLKQTNKFFNLKSIKHHFKGSQNGAVVGASDGSDMSKFIKSYFDELSSLDEDENSNDSFVYSEKFIFTSERRYLLSFYLLFSNFSNFPDFSISHFEVLGLFIISSVCVLLILFGVLYKRSKRSKLDGHLEPLNSSSMMNNTNTSSLSSPLSTSSAAYSNVRSSYGNSTRALVDEALNKCNNGKKSFSTITKTYEMIIGDEENYANNHNGNIKVKLAHGNSTKSQFFDGNSNVIIC